MKWQGRLWGLAIPVAVVWLALLAYTLDAAAGVIACELHIDEEIIGETVVAAGDTLTLQPSHRSHASVLLGTSMPNVLAAILAGRSGQVDVATSQAFGSNTFDILVAFGLPYLIKVILNHGEPVHIEATGAEVSGFVCLGVLAFYIGLLVVNRWRLTKCVGWTFIALYVLYVVFVVLSDLLVYS